MAGVTSVLKAVASIVLFLGPVIFATIAIGMRREVRSSQFWLRISLLGLAWLALWVLLILWLEPLGE
jgi:hypothetical protein